MANSGIRVGERRRYFIAVLIELNLLLSSTAPVLFTMVTMARAIPAAIRAYSIAVAPFSSAMKDLSKLITSSAASDPGKGRAVRDPVDRSARFLCAPEKVINALRLIRHDSLRPGSAGRSKWMKIGAKPMACVAGYAVEIPEVPPQAGVWTDAPGQDANAG